MYVLLHLLAVSAFVQLECTNTSRNVKHDDDIS